MGFHRKANNHLKSLYPIFIEIGVIGTLLILILIANIKLPEINKTVTFSVADEGPPLILPPNIIGESVIEPPPVPQIPIELPDDSPIEQPPLEFDEYDMASRLEVPPLLEEVRLEVDFERLKAIDVLPEMIGGEQALRSSIEYPPYALNNGIEGIVEVEFIVTKTGKVVNPVILKGIGGGCDEAVLKGIKKQRFTPGVKDGRLAEFKVKELVQFIIVGAVR